MNRKGVVASVVVVVVGHRHCFAKDDVSVLRESHLVVKILLEFCHEASAQL